MGLTITQREVNGVEMLHAEGRIALGEECNLLRQKVREILGSGKMNIVLNLKDVNFVDSAGLGTLLAIYESINAQHGTFKLASPSPQIMELLVVTKLTTVFEISKAESAG
ncbi:MAG: STAS domain-containing protein [Candidatus Acidiferrales bacterium]